MSVIKRIIDIRIKHCNNICPFVEEYVGLKRIKFGVEMGYRKCTVCECHFFKPDYNVCKCCGTKLRLKMRDRTMAVKQKALVFITEIGNSTLPTVQK